MTTTKNAQDWLTEIYELPGYDGVTEKQRVAAIEYNGNNEDEILEGELKIENFPNLQILSLPGHRLTSVKISGCPELKVVELFNNKLTEYRVENNLPGTKKIKEVNLADNNFTNFNQIYLSVWNGSVEKLFLQDNNFEEQDSSKIGKFIISTGIKKLNLGCSEEGVRKGKHNKFFGSIDEISIPLAGDFLDLDISGTNISKGLDDFFFYHRKNRLLLRCNPRRDGDEVKKLYDQLGQPKDGITLDKDTYENLLKKQTEQQEEAKKWEPIKTQYQNIFTKISNSDCWKAIELYNSLYQIKTPDGDMPNELGDLLHEARMKTHELIKEFGEKQVKKEDITDEQLEILEKKIIPFEQRLTENMHKWGWINDQQKQENIDGLKEFLQKIQAEKQRRKNPSSPPTGGSGGNNSDPLFGNAPTNLPTDKGTPSNHQKDSPSQNSPDNSKGDKKDIPSPQKDNKSDSTDQKNREKIEQSKDIEEARENAKQILTEVFQNTSVKLSDLDKNLWGNEKNPEEYLKKLSSKEEITNFIQKLRQNIKSKEEQKNKHSNNNEKKGKGNGALVGFGIVFAVLVGGVILAVVIRNKRRKKKSWEN
jgi:hypothetical protein